MTIEAFDPGKTAINRGISLIEASAGTGKTYTIAMLVLRMVVEFDISIQRILVVTFTIAATNELKERIRARLVQANTALKNGACEDINLQDWLQGLDLSPELIRQRLELALLDIDQAGIFTIHGFCQRVLSEHALASGQLFKVDLTDDLAAIRQTYTDDFWRREILNRPPWSAGVLTSIHKTPEQLLGSIGSAGNDCKIYPEDLELDNALDTLKLHADAASAVLGETIAALMPHAEAGLFNTSFNEKLPHCADLLGRWLSGASDTPPESAMLALFSTNSLLAGLNGNKFRKNKELSGEERKSEFLATLPIGTEIFDALAKAFDSIAIALRKKLLENLLKDLDKQLEQMNLWSFDSLISFLAEALHGERGEHLSGELRQRFSAALIDEFQDTDAQQWHIFSTLFAVPSHYLMLVGDPKQAIYKFRGADIYSYLAAQQQAQYHFTLIANWRSHPGLVAGINHLFAKDNIFQLAEIGFSDSEPALTAEHGALYENGKPALPIALWQLAPNEDKGYWNPLHNTAADLIKNAVVNEIVALLTEDFTVQPKNSRLKPGDIAILVRTNSQARVYQQTLAAARVPSVLGNTESVMKSEEARHLYTLLDAISHPGDSNRLGQALALNWFAYDGQSLYQLLHSVKELDGLTSQFANYFHIWQQKDLMAMMQCLVEEQGITCNMAQLPFAERRLTNLQHILELLQQAIIEEGMGCQKTLAWLKSAMTDPHQSAENRQLRLESDADAVKVITMHRAKGLEFPVVFCPLLWDRQKKRGVNGTFVQCYSREAGKWLVDLGSPDYDKHVEQAEFEQRAEDMRIAYVALTRAKYRCYIAWADARTDEQANRSPLAELLAFKGLDFLKQQEDLQTLQNNYPESFTYRMIAYDTPLSGVYQPVKTTQQLSAKTLHRSLYTHWQMSSYTALSALSLKQAPELPVDKADERESVAFEGEDQLPAGPHTGNVIHELLEVIAFPELSAKPDISRQRAQSCQRFGLTLDRPEIIDALLAEVVTTPLTPENPDFTLANLPPAQCLKEMPFYLAVAGCRTAEINRVLRAEPAFQPLTEKQLSGFLTGFIDLICEFDGLYYVMDYKTNLLTDYSKTTLLDAMREHNYGLQYWLYCLVLHRYLQIRKPGYCYDRHFGGVRYLFVRGMRRNLPMHGIFADRPELVKLEALSTLFNPAHAQ